MSVSRAVVLAVAVAGSTACASAGALPARPAWETLPEGSPLRTRSLPESDAWLRHHVMFGEYEQALDVLGAEEGVPGDELWRALQRGVVLHDAGDYRASNEAFEWAEAEADRRYTKSVSRAAASVQTFMSAATSSRASAPSPTSRRRPTPIW